VPGRNTYDQVKKFGQWRHKGKRAYVLSSNQISTSTSNGEAKRAGAASKLIP
jgi:dihydrofolate reductase